MPLAQTPDSLAPTSDPDPTPCADPRPFAPCPDPRPDSLAPSADPLRRPPTLCALPLAQTPDSLAPTSDPDPTPLRLNVGQLKQDVGEPVVCLWA